VVKYSATYQRDGEWWIGYVAELPGANAQGRTLAEARDSLREAVELIVSTNRELAQRRAADAGRDGEVVQEDLLVPV
jgi:predicted RNase H-like HicB family nuclease